MGGYLGITTKGHAQRKRNTTQSLEVESTLVPMSWQLQIKRCQEIWLVRLIFFANWAIKTQLVHLENLYLVYVYQNYSDEH